MKITKICLLAICGIVAVSSAFALDQKEKEAGFVSLFNGKDLSGWIGDTNHYAVEDGNIVCHGRNIYTADIYTNFDLKFEFKLTRGANNGLGVRTTTSGDAAYNAIELQILDNTAPQYAKLHDFQYHGSVYGLVPAKRGFLKPVGEWNSEEVIAIGPKIKVILNGTVILDTDLSKIKDTKDNHPFNKHPGMHNKSGHLAFLGHGSPVHFRNIRVKKLPAATENKSAKKKAVVPPEGFVALFNGKDLSGWQGLLKRPYDNPIKRGQLSVNERLKLQLEADKLMRDHWKVANGTLVYDGKGRSLCTIKNYDNFELLVDWKIEKDGDSGIYLHGTPQVQIWDRPDIGSGGIYNNKKHPSNPLTVADTPIGQWNRFRIKMCGDKVKVHLNGKLVTDTVMENYWDRRRPIFATGPIELQHHGSTLRFKDIFIRKIPLAEAVALPEDGFTPLFDGKTLNGWIRKNGKATYRAENGCIIGKTAKNSPNSFLCTTKEYGDFELRFEVKLLNNELNSGVQIRSTTRPPKNGEKFGRVNGPQVEIEACWPQGCESGYIYGEACGGWMTPKDKLIPLKIFRNGEWNYYRVVAKGPRIQTWLNGIQISDLVDKQKFKTHPKGFIGLQVHTVGNKGPFQVAWRNIRIKPL